MPRFSELSIRRLESCHQDLQLVFLETVQHFDCSVLSGHRSKEEQNRVFLEGKSLLQYPDSKHNSLPSLAVDVVPYPIDWKDKERFYYFAGYVKRIAQELRRQKVVGKELRWGGDWDRDTSMNDQSFFDLPHFELVDTE